MRRIRCVDERALAHGPSEGGLRLHRPCVEQGQARAESATCADVAISVQSMRTIGAAATVACAVARRFVGGSFIGAMRTPRRSCWYRHRSDGARRICDWSPAPTPRPPWAAGDWFVAQPFTYRRRTQSLR